MKELNAKQQKAKQDFLSELNLLLSKYDATIRFEVDEYNCSAVFAALDIGLDGCESTGNMLTDESKAYWDIIDISANGVNEGKYRVR